MLQLLKDSSSKINDEPSSTSNSEPIFFKEVWHYKDPVQCKKWETMSKDFGDIAYHIVWKVTKCHKIPVGRQCVKNNWAFKVK